MKKLLFTIAILSSLISSQAFCKVENSSENFEGASISLGLGATSYISSYEYKTGALSSHDDVGKNSFVAVANLQYLHPLTSNWLIGAGITYDLNNPKETKNTFDSNLVGHYSAKVKLKNHLSYYLQPTYAINSSSAIYGKIGYHTINANLSDGGELNYGGFDDYKSNLKGIGYGIGLVTFFNKNIFVRAEIEHVNYNRVNISYNPGNPFNSGDGKLKYRLKSTAGIFSFGYLF